MLTPRQLPAMCLLWCACVSVSFLSRTSDAAPGDPTPDVSRTADELQRCPLWKDIAPQDAIRRQEVTDVYLSLAHYPTDIIRAGVNLYLKRYPDSDARYTEAGYKVFALERVVFRVPARFRVGEQVPYALLGNPIKVEGVTTYIDFLWPFSIDNRGRLALSGFGVGQISGAPYNAMHDFDQMAAQLPRRFDQAEVKPGAQLRSADE
jgi:hypothetical protein